MAKLLVWRVTQFEVVLMMLYAQVGWRVVL